MKITKKHNNGLESFCNVDPGTVFLSKNNYYMKTEFVQTEDSSVNAVNLQTGDLLYFDYVDAIKVCEVEMIVEV